MTATTTGAREHEFLLTVEAARLLGVHPTTITRWDRAGKFPPGAVIRTLGGHRRYHRAAVEQLRRNGSRS